MGSTDGPVSSTMASSTCSGEDLSLACPSGVPLLQGTSAGSRACFPRPLAGFWLSENMPALSPHGSMGLGPRCLELGSSHWKDAVVELPLPDDQIRGLSSWGYVSKWLEYGGSFLLEV